MRKSIIAQAILFLTLLLVGGGAYAKNNLPLDKLNLPQGFEIEIFAEVPNARQMSVSENGIVYVGSRRLGKVHAVVDSNRDGRGDRVVELDKDLNLPSGVTWRDGDLFVAAVSTVYRYRQMDDYLLGKKKEKPVREVVTDSLPTERHHGWKFIEFGPDGMLYVPVGAPCNICLSEDEVYASILRFDVDQSPVKPEVFVHGVRNSVGFDFSKKTKNLWFTDNGRDNLGDDSPPCELNEVTKAGQHFGYPYFHGHSITDPEFGSYKTAGEYTEPALALGPHVAPLGMTFIDNTNWPASYQDQILIAEHGSWNRSAAAGHTGYRLTLARRDNKGDLHYEVFIDGWLQNNEGWGRPVDIVNFDDGSLLVSDDRAGVIYRISYSRDV